MRTLVSLIPLFLFLLLINFSNCKNDKPTSLTQPWDQIIIQTDGQIITISRQKGYPCYSRILAPKDTTQDFVLSEIVKDSVYDLVHDLIQNPVIPDQYINAGAADNVTLTINYKQVDITADYKYVKSWRDLSDKTKILYSILSKKVTFKKNNPITG